jgi:hypothetical protein
MTRLQIKPCSQMNLFVDVVFCYDQREFGEFVDGIDREDTSFFQVNEENFQEPENLAILLFCYNHLDIGTITYQCSKAALAFAGTYVNLLDLDDDDDDEVAIFNSAVADATAKLVSEVHNFAEKHCKNLVVID